MSPVNKAPPSNGAVTIDMDEVLLTRAVCHRFMLVLSQTTKFYVILAFFPKCWALLLLAKACASYVVFQCLPAQ